MPASKVVVVGASAGGIDTLVELVRGLPADFPAPILVVLHISADSPGVLAQILGRAARMEAKTAEHGEHAKAGVIYTAPPDLHLTIEHGGTLRTVRGPRENRHRPAIDPLFRSAAIAYAENAIGVILSGTLDDGTAGLRALEAQGGIAIVQDPEDALYSGMPQNALANGKADYVLPVSEIATQLITCIAETRQPRKKRDDRRMLEMETRITEMDHDALAGDERPGHPSAFSCPDCGGVLWEIDDENAFARFRCRVGHAYGPEAMLGAQAEQLEEALWSAMKTLEESARLAARLADSERHRGHGWLVKRFEKREAEARQRADLIRKLIAQSE